MLDEDDDETADISDLFTIKDYSSVNITIPCWNGENTRPLHMQIASSVAAATDHDLTGQILWPVSVLLSHYLASKRGQELIAHRNVVELGAGVGLPGLVSAHFANKVVLTDGNDIVMELLHQNCDTFIRNNDDADQKSYQHKSKVSCCKLVWGDRMNLKSLQRIVEPVDVIIAADVVQWPAVVEPFLHSVKALLWNSRCKEPRCILGLVSRASKTTHLFHKLCEELGFSVEKVDPFSFISEGEIPAECQEHGGRKTEIYEVILKSRLTMPILLDESGDERDCTVGKTFENTLCLPY